MLKKYHRKALFCCLYRHDMEGKKWPQLWKGCVQRGKKSRRSSRTTLEKERLLYLIRSIQEKTWRWRQLGKFQTAFSNVWDKATPLLVVSGRMSPAACRCLPALHSTLLWVVLCLSCVWLSWFGWSSGFGITILTFAGLLLSFAFG